MKRDALLARFLDNRFALEEKETEIFHQTLEKDPSFALLVREQLMMDELLSQSLGMDRKDFPAQVRHRVRAGRGGNDFPALVLRRARSRPVRGRRWGWERWAVVAVLLVGIAVGLFTLDPGTSPAPRRVLAGQLLVNGVENEEVPEGARVRALGNAPAVIELEDLSRVELAPESEAVLVKAQEGGRVIRLERGSGTFTVTKQERRFEVVTDVGRVGVLGTEFSVALRSPSGSEQGGKTMIAEAALMMVVTVLSGGVEVTCDGETTLLQAGMEQVFSVGKDGPDKDKEEKEKGPKEKPEKEKGLAGGKDGEKVSPGQAKKGVAGGGDKVPPGQAKRGEGKVPPGQLKKQERAMGATEGEKVPPGQLRKQERTMGGTESGGGELPDTPTGKGKGHSGPGTMTGGSGKSGKIKGNNGVGNGIDPQPPGNPRVNDGPGTGPGNPGNKGGAGNGGGPGNSQGKGKGGQGNSGKGKGGNHGNQDDDQGEEGEKDKDKPDKEEKGKGNQGKGKGKGKHGK